MPHPLAYLGSLFQEPQPAQPLDARLAKTCTKWDVAQMVTDDVHAELQAMPLNNAEDLPRFHRTLVDLSLSRLNHGLPRCQAHPEVGARHERTLWSIGSRAK